MVTATGFDPVTRRFESFLPCHKEREMTVEEFVSVIDTSIDLFVIQDQNGERLWGFWDCDFTEAPEEIQNAEVLKIETDECFEKWIITVKRP